MHKYHFDIKTNERSRNNAGTKATEDCRNILIKAGFQDLELYFKKSVVLMPFNFLKLLAKFIYYSFTIKSNSFIIVQYPLKGINNSFRHFIKILHRKGCKVACIVHDLDSLRVPKNEQIIEKEIKRLTAYDALISHNPSMSNWLKHNGYKGYLKEIFLFDYLVDTTKDDNSCVKSHYNQVVFAGNLGRGNFLPSLINVNALLNLNLYGVGFNGSLLKENSNVKWKGSYSADQIVNEITGDFGLVWDGDRIDDIGGIMGDYMRYNTPHKTSLYLAAGLPVIVSGSAAISGFIETNDLGIVVNSLSDISPILATITEERYRKMCQNVAEIRNNLLLGNFLKHAVSNIQQRLYN